jgi:hypothetical protein
LTSQRRSAASVQWRGLVDQDLQDACQCGRQVGPSVTEACR